MSDIKIKAVITKFGDIEYIIHRGLQDVLFVLNEAEIQRLFDSWKRERSEVLPIQEKVRKHGD